MGNPMRIGQRWRSCTFSCVKHHAERDEYIKSAERDGYFSARDVATLRAKLAAMPSDAITLINAAMDAAATAQEAGDYKTALKKVESAWMRLCTLPDSQFQDERLEWSRDGMKSLMEWLQKKANSQAAADTSGKATVIRPIDILYTRG